MEDCENGTNEQADEVQLPEYVCHKRVRGAKITEIEQHESNGEGHQTMVFGEIKGSRFLSDEWNERHKPEVGGYFVVYEGGYTSYSPSEAFEGGYSLA